MNVTVHTSVQQILVQSLKYTCHFASAYKSFVTYCYAYVRQAEVIILIVTSIFTSQDTTSHYVKQTPGDKVDIPPITFLLSLTTYKWEN
jgi:hypothetical protein